MTTPRDPAAEKLVIALEAARDNEHEAALSALIDAWRITPTRALGDLVVSRSEELVRPTPDFLYPSKATAAQRVSGWNLESKTPTLLGVGQMARTLTDGIRAKDVYFRVRWFGTARPDPRVVSAYLEMIKNPPWTAGSNRELWAATFAQLEVVHRDARTLTVLEDVIDRYLDIFGHTTMGDWMQKALARLESSLKSHFRSHPAELSDQAETILVAITECLSLPANESAESKALAGQSRTILGTNSSPLSPPSPPSPEENLDSSDAWLAYIAEDPDQDSRIEAFSSWLREQDDPRAEFIDIQLRRHRAEVILGAEEKRERELQKKYQKEWLGPIAGAVPSTPQGFERGVLTRCTLAPKGKLAPLAVGHPGWATVKSVDAGSGRKDVSFLLKHPVFASVREVVHASPDLFDFYARDSVPHRIERLHVTYGPHPDDIDASFDAPGLPHLRDLGMTVIGSLRVGEKQASTSGWHEPEAYAGFFSSPMVARLEVIHLNVHGHMLSSWIEALQRIVPPRVTARMQLHRDFTLTRDVSGKYTRLASTLAATDTHFHTDILTRLVAPSLTRLEIVWRGQRSPDPALQVRWKNALEALTSGGLDVIET